MPVSVTVRPWPSSDAGHSFLLSDDSDVARVVSGPSSQRTAVGDMFLHNGRPYLQAVSENYDIFINNCAEPLPTLRGAVLLQDEDRLHIASQHCSFRDEILLVKVAYHLSPLPQLPDVPSSNSFPATPRYVLPKAANSSTVPCSPTHSTAPSAPSPSARLTSVPTTVLAADTLPSEVQTLPSASSPRQGSLRPRPLLIKQHTDDIVDDCLRRADLLSSPHSSTAISSPSPAFSTTTVISAPCPATDDVTARNYLVRSPPDSAPTSPDTFRYGDFVRASTPYRLCVPPSASHCDRLSTSDAGNRRADDTRVLGIIATSDTYRHLASSGQEVLNDAPSLAVTSVPTSVSVTTSRSTSPSLSPVHNDLANLCLSDTNDAVSSHRPDRPEQPTQYTSAVAAAVREILTRSDTPPSIFPTTDAPVPRATSSVPCPVSSALVALGRVQIAWTQARRWMQERERLSKPSYDSSIHQAIARVFSAWMDARRALDVDVLSPLAATTTGSQSTISTPCVLADSAPEYQPTFRAIKATAPASA
ncbi:hypothetical protein CF336_g8330, partial [Tilletia laevis]